MATRPALDSLPLRKGDPAHSAWGLYGEDDQPGFLNLLTPEVVAEAATEIKIGARVGLALPLNTPSPGAHNMLFKHRIINKAPRAVHDDIVDMNTQCSSQWDGFRHLGYQQANKFFNGYTAGDFGRPETSMKNAWCAKGIAGRGDLLDYYTWAKKHGIEYKICEAYPVPLAHLEACAEWEGVTFKMGDMLLIRLADNTPISPRAKRKEMLYRIGFPPWLGWSIIGNGPVAMGDRIQCLRRRRLGFSKCSNLTLQRAIRTGRICTNSC